MVEDSISLENFGLALPTGSNKTKCRIEQGLLIYAYLNEGMGKPCAGQTKAMESSSRLRKANKSISDPNLGFELPIGSESDCKWWFFTLIQSLHLPKSWHR